MSDRDDLAAVIAGFPSVLVGFSGGVDSALLAVVARQVLGRDRSVAAIGVSPSLATEQRTVALDIAATFDLNLVEVPTDELDETREVVRTVMEGVAELRVPLVVDMGFGPNWAEAK